MPAYDVVVVGAGYIGCAAAYYCASAGLRTLLVDRGRIPGGASLANFGNVQVQDAELDHSLPMITAGYRRVLAIEDELDCPVGLASKGSLLLIENEAQWAIMADRLPQLHRAGIAAELIDASRLHEVEPLLDTRKLLGACYHADEARVTPFAFLHAFLHRGRERGLHVRPDTEVTGFAQAGGRITGVTTPSGVISTGCVVLTTGAWTRALGETLERTWHASYIHGQAIITAASEQRLHNHLSSAAFFEEMATDSAAETAVFAVAQTAHGHFLLGEACSDTPRPASHCTAGAAPAVAQVALRFLPGIARLTVLRGWAVPVAYTDDGLPLFGLVGGLGGLILATAFKSTVIITPLVGEAVARLITTGKAPFDIAAFSPDRPSKGAVH